MSPASGKIVIASRNTGKIKEIRSILSNSGVTIRSLDDYPNLPDITEDGHSFLENAFKKAKSIAEAIGETVLADDSGLEVEALNGAPGIYSARYAGEEGDDKKNILKLLHDMKDVPTMKRKAVFRCVLVLYRREGRYHVFDGIWEGRIAEVPTGKEGFGYDPVFYLPERGVTAAELPEEIKNRISHRGLATEKLKMWIENEYWNAGRSAAR